MHHVRAGASLARAYARGAVDDGGIAMRARRFRLVTAVLTVLLLVLLAAPASADPGGVPHIGGPGGWGAAVADAPDDPGGFIP